MKQLVSILVIVIGLLLILPLLGVDALESVSAWAIPINFIAIGIIGLVMKGAKENL